MDDNYGRYIGEFKGLAHGVRGAVYAVDENTLYIRGFYYDGIGPSECENVRRKNKTYHPTVLDFHSAACYIRKHFTVPV